jgi:hypothetical protein
MIASQSVWLYGDLRSSSSEAACRKNYASASIMRNRAKPVVGPNSVNKAICAKRKANTVRTVARKSSCANLLDQLALLAKALDFSAGKRAVESRRTL